MRGRIARRTVQADGPSPFSSAWLATDTPPEPRTRFRLPGWIPDGRALSAAMVVAVSLATAIVTLQGNPGITTRAPVTPVVVTANGQVEAAAPEVPSTDPETPAPEPDRVALAGSELDAAPEWVAAPESDVGTEDSGGAQAPTAEVPDEVMSSLAVDQDSPLAVAPAEGALLPTYRIVSFYGHPHDANMGIVGELPMQELATALRNEASNYAAADPSRPVIPAIELIATVAQRVPGIDGTYILDTDHETLVEYIDFAEEQGMLVILDVQVGRGTVAQEIEKVRDLLARPHVHLAIDPEFAVAEGQTPGEYIGSVPAESIVYAQQALAEISAEHGIGPKILIVHQFREDMIQGKEQLEPYPGVQLVIDADGYGAPELKTAVYNFLVRDEPVEFAGVKLFYRQDVPVMTPQEILALVPSPDVIIYQ